MSNEYFNSSNAPATGSQLSSATIRAEFAAIETGLDKLPAMSGNANKVLKVNAGASALTSSTITDDGTNVSISGDLTVNGGNVTVGAVGPDADSQHVLPNVTSDTLTLLGATQTLTNKTISADSNTLSGIAASSFVLSDASGNIDGSAAQKVIPSGDVVGTTDAQTLTNKTLTSPDINGGTIDGTVIGGTTPAAGSFTTLTTSSTVTHNGGTANGVLYLDGSKVATSGSALTFDGTTLAAPLTSLSGNGVVLTVDRTGTGGNDRTNVQFSNSGIVRGGIGTVGSADGIYFNQGTTEGMRLTSTGLGIGTSSPSSFSGYTTVSVNNATNGGIYNILVNGTETARLQAYSGIFNVAAKGAATNLTFETNGAERMRLDASGNLGLGVTPSAWDSSILTALQVRSASISSIPSGLNDIYFSSNAYYNDGWKYINTSFATQYRQANGSHTWSTAPSGTAGNAITFTQAMTLDASGNLGVGVTNLEAKLHIEAAGSTANLRLASATKSSVNIVAARDGFGYWPLDLDADGIQFLISNTERARIDSSGCLRIGTTTFKGSSVERFTVVGQVAGTAQGTGVATEPAWNVWHTAESGDNIFSYFYEGSVGITRGSITYNRGGGLVAYNTTSDYRAKTLTGPVANPGATIDALQVYTGKMNGATIERPMLVAHEAQAIVPYAVTGEKDAVNENGDPIYQQMDHSSLVPLLIVEIQNLRTRVAALETN